MNVAAKQNEYFDRIASDYVAHYDDPLSTEYRQRFLFKRMFDGVPLAGSRVLDAMCGAGATTAYVRSRGAQASGLDVNAKVLEQYRRSFPDAEVIESSFLNTSIPDASYDVVAVVGGLHHLQPHVPAAFDEVYRILRPGGHFVFVEPESGTLPDVFRKLWYRLDRYFEDNEASIDLRGILRHEAARFEAVSFRRGGGPAYFLVFNSLVLRVPLSAKKHIASPLFAVEKLMERALPRWLSSFVIAQLRKRGA